MIDDWGAPVTDGEVIDRVVSSGSVVARRAPVEKDDIATWRRGLR